MSGEHCYIAMILLASDRSGVHVVATHASRVKPSLLGSTATLRAYETQRRRTAPDVKFVACKLWVADEMNGGHTLNGKAAKTCFVFAVAEASLHSCGTRKVGEIYF
jgi:hypothetical protein